MTKAQARVLQYLVDHPRWLYGSDLVEAGVGSRVMVYTTLDELEDDGYVETRPDPQPKSALIRTQHRATGKRAPDEEFDGDLVT